jgi:cytosine/adenosine deaminase-related metal-dependent hydrolase
MTNSPLLIRNATIVTMNDRFEIVHGDVWVRDGRIVEVGATHGQVDESPATVVDARGGFLIPGFVQTHVHLCQTLFRGYADDRPLLDWLRQRIWPMEAAHTEASLAASARLAAAELLRSGTTTVLTMETVHDTDVVFDVLEASGIRATVGKCMMDADSEVPPRLREATDRSIQESLRLRDRWNGRAGGRLRAAFAPRFAVSCTRELLEAVGALSRDLDVLVHTHASESRDEIEIVRRLSGTTNIRYLAELGLASPRLCAAHCVWVDEDEQRLLAQHDVKVMHCPGSNLKLGSGIAPVSDLLAAGVCVSLGADGAACNNHLDMFGEMRLAAALQAVRRQPGALTARQALWMATRNGARTLGLDADIGSIEPGKRADLALIDRDRPHLSTGDDPFSAIVYAARPDDVRLTMVDGEILVRDFQLCRIDASALASQARAEGAALARRAGL